MANGKIIVIEGACDGIGKSTQLKLLEERLLEEGYDIFTHHFPTYNSAQGSLVEEFLKGDFSGPGELSPYLINSFYAVDRGVTWYHNIKNEYEKGKIILLDRYTTSSLIFQSAFLDSKDEKIKFIDFVSDYEYNKIGIKSPDKVIFLTAPFDLVHRLRAKRKTNDGILEDVFEKNKEIQEKVYENAKFVVDYCKWDILECFKSNKLDTIEEIHENIYNMVKRLIDDKR